MTDAGPMPEPSNADLLAFMQTAFAHLTTEIGGVKADVADLGEAVQHQLAQAEARLTSRISDVQQVVQRMKADLAAHVADDHGQPHAA